MYRSNFGNAFFGLSFLLIVALAILQVRAMKASHTEELTLGIHSIDDYERLVDNEIFPLNKIPEEAHRSIANSLVFNQQHDLIAGSLVEIKTFLNRDEQGLFLSLIFGAKVNFISKYQNGQSTHQDSTTQSSNPPLYLVHEVDGKFQILTGV